MGQRQGLESNFLIRNSKDAILEDLPTSRKLSALNLAGVEKRFSATSKSELGLTGANCKAAQDHADTLMVVFFILLRTVRPTRLIVQL